MADPTSGFTQQDPEDSASDWRSRQFQIERTLARVRTMVWCQVKSKTGGDGAVAAPGTVNVQPLVKIVDGNGNVSSHGTIMNVPVFRVGGGDGAIIVDPAEGDIGWLAVSDRDSSAVIANNGEAQPGSRRKFNLADGVYMGKLLGDAPVQYITFTSDGMQWHDRNDNNIISNSAGVSINGMVVDRSGVVQGALKVNGNLQLGANVLALNGSEYGGDISTTGRFFGSDFFHGAGVTLVSLTGHFHAANNTPPTPGH